MGCIVYRFVLFSVLLSFFVLLAGAVNPSGATVTNGTSTSAPEDDAGSHLDAIAGNVTELNIFGFSNTQSWQGYYGNVTGTIQLANNNDKVMYNWSLVSPRGEVYASVSNSLNWTGIDCFNMAQNASYIETLYNIPSYAVDGVNETFNLNDHGEFFTNNKQFTAGVCNNTKLYGDEATGIFDVVLMTDGDNVVFTSLLKDNTPGFDGLSHDFQMVVLEDGHGTNILSSSYYFWVELE